MINKHIVKKYIKKCCTIFNIVNVFIKKNEKQILIYTNLGFRDNVKSLYDYLILNSYNSKYKIICAMDRPEMEFIGKGIFNVKLVNKYVGVYYFLTSKFCFYCFGQYPINPSQTQVVMHMWHGMPLKKIGNIENKLKSINYNYFSYILATSDFFKPIMQKAFLCTDKQIYIGGQPKTDDLFHTLPHHVYSKLNICEDNYRCIVAWLPTYRQSSKLNSHDVNMTPHQEIPYPLIDSSQKLAEINKILRKSDTLLIIKEHPMQDSSFINVPQMSNIMIISDDDLKKEEVALYSLLSITSALISDYSSAYIDYLLLDRPIAFIVDDYKEYAQTRGFVVPDITQYFPGDNIYDLHTFKTFIDNVISGNDNFMHQRHKVCNLFNEYQDGENTKRILGFCGIVL